MAQFIQVRGPDPDYQGSYRTMLLSVNSIVRIVPVFAEQAKDENWLCTEDYPKATIVFYKLIDVHGKEYAVAKSVLEKIGAEFDLAIPNADGLREGHWPNKRKPD